MAIDVSKAEDFEAAARRIEEQWGGLNILVNNAGIMDSAKVQDITPEQWRRIVEISFRGVVYGCHAFVPILIRQKSGYVLNMASSAGLLALQEMAHYIAHDSMEFLWFVKRLMPETIYRLFAWMYANKKWRFKDG